MVAERGAVERLSPARPNMQELYPDDLAALRLRRGKRLDVFTMRGVLADYRGRSVWVPDSLEYAFLAPWRHRAEIALVQELVAVSNAEVLLREAVARCDAAGNSLMLMLEMDEIRPPVFYARSGMERLEDVITYQLRRPATLPPVSGSLTFEPIPRLDRTSLAELVRIDHAAFPWLWWNTEAEFAAYAATPGVRTYLGRYQGQTVAYLGLTSYPGWGHLDRIAIDPAWQGQGLGHEALAFAIGELVRRGGRRIALSTQGANVRSQRLYERFGFRRSPNHDYRLYGAVLRPPAPGVTFDP